MRTEQEREDRTRACGIYLMVSVSGGGGSITGRVRSIDAETEMQGWMRRGW